MFIAPPKLNFKYIYFRKTTSNKLVTSKKVRKIIIIKKIAPKLSRDNMTSQERVTIYTCAGGRDSSCSLLLNRGGATEERRPTLLYLRIRRRDILILVPIDIVYAGTPVSLISYTSLDIQLRFSSLGCLTLYSIMSVALHCYYSTSLPHLVSHQHSSVWQQFSYE